MDNKEFIFQLTIREFKELMREIIGCNPASETKDVTDRKSTRLNSSH